MINQQFKQMLTGKSVIRELSEYATARGREIGYENVYDFSLGNPSVAAPQSFTDVCVNLLQEKDPMAVHGYSPSLGNPEFKQAVADSLNRRFGMEYTAGHIFPTTGAAGALAHALRAVTEPGDEVITFAPYFTEYNPYVAGAGARLVVVPANPETFQIDIDVMEAQVNAHTAAILINSPNNPSGALYTAETLTALGESLRRLSARFGHTIFLISDEPYREIVFDGVEAPYISKFYEHTLSCYSYSKALSLPGERIGYVAVNPACEDAASIVPMCGQISRGLGHNCPPSLIQQAVAQVVDDTSDLSVYEVNRNIIYEQLVQLGFTVVKPGGTFYIYPQTLEPDSVAFCRKARDYDLIFVPGDGFMTPGYCRLAYCIDTDKVRRAMDRLAQFVREVY
ncbi:MAG: pyridoxal phosphate-dependent aminotransferase [Butyrivibrio sp.]|nr:pyridoxal phosphate-dependent aminotransferase [Butyrivibrio sp.]